MKYMLPEMCFGSCYAYGSASVSSSLIMLLTVSRDFWRILVCSNNIYIHASGQLRPRGSTSQSSCILPWGLRKIVYISGLLGLWTSGDSTEIMLCCPGLLCLVDSLMQFEDIALSESPAMARVELVGPIKKVWKVLGPMHAPSHLASVTRLAGLEQGGFNLLAWSDWLVHSAPAWTEVQPQNKGLPDWNLQTEMD